MTEHEPDDVQRAYELREKMREQAQSIPGELRSEYFAGDEEKPPMLFVDGADPAPTFVGIRDDDWDEKLEAALDAVAGIVTAGDPDGGSRPAGGDGHGAGR